MGGSALDCVALRVSPQLKEENHVFKPASGVSIVCFTLPRPETQRVIFWKKRKEKNEKTFWRCTLRVQFVAFPTCGFSTTAISHFCERSAVAR